MIVTFRPTINNASDYSSCYINFLRCVTAIATASAGTTTLTVNPYTASNAIDTTKNCIISIDANTEAGGWTTSASHSVPSSGNNTATTFTAIASSTLYQYKADFYNNSGKSAFPFKKLCFHSLENCTDSNSNPWRDTTGSNTTNAKSLMTANQYHQICATFGHHTTTDWSAAGFAPQGNTTTSHVNNPAVQGNSWTLNAMHRANGAATGAPYDRPSFCFTDTTVEYHMAITADYCILWESKVGDTYVNGYFITDTSGNGTTYWDGGRQGGIFYMGLREAQPWENAQNNNTPWVCWQHTQQAYLGNTIGNALSGNNVAALMHTLNNNNVPTTTPRIYRTQNGWNNNYFFFKTSTVAAYAAYGSRNVEIDVPLFFTRRMGGPAGSGDSGPTNSNMLYMPAYDTTQGLNVPPAYPIKISRCYTGEWNQGGACRGIFKSLSMPWTTMKLYWQSPTQTFTIGSDTYIPFVLNEDMWLVRYA